VSTANFSTYDQVGKVEDVSDVITNLSPTKTPFQSMIGTETVHNTLYEWQEDSLIAAGANAAIEGATAPTATMNPTVMRSNYTQILTKTAQATDTSAAVRAWGRDNELAYQKGLRSLELKRDLEYAFVGSHQAAVAGNSSTTARKFANYQPMVDPTVTYTVNGTGGVLNSGVGSPTAAAIREDCITTTLQQLYIDGAEPDTLMVTPATKPVISALAHSNRTVMVDNGDRKLTNTIDVYDSDFGPIKFVINRFLVTGDALLFEAPMWKRAVLRNWQTVQLAKTGDSTNVQIKGEFGLIHKNFLASGLITNLNT